jgi:hypothetical protein
LLSGTVIIPRQSGALVYTVKELLGENYQRLHLMWIYFFAYVSFMISQILPELREVRGGGPFDYCPK